MRLCCRCAGGHGSSQVLAQDSQSEGGDVPQRAGGDPGRDRAVRVREGHGAALPSAGQVCVQSSLPGEPGCMSFFLLLHAKEDVLKNINQLAAD